MEAKAKTAMVCLSEGMTLTTTNFQMKFITSIAAAAAVIGASFIAVAPEAKADYYSTNRIGNSTYTYGSNGSSFNTNSIGGTTFYNGRTRDGYSYSGSCTTIGSTTFCN